MAKILDENQWSWAVTGAHQGGGLDCTLLIVKTEGRLPASASDVTFDLDVAATLRARAPSGFNRSTLALTIALTLPNPNPNPNPITLTLTLTLTLTKQLRA